MLVALCPVESLLATLAISSSLCSRCLFDILQAHLVVQLVRFFSQTVSVPPSDLQLSSRVLFL
ncbi:hypothetical protein F3Y22_tig00116951pilonHSYRG00866 [Hibiscus syriacus]|uniref:Secreted protein n=1 Tax=Hibiscus syriacus TaxID=106335 RepID=A0A6A2WLG1_HIBSY|nr:hypothetical protein F3Y22_tig00116951pilonHSYRG00866 [Hibiscus syriacus]